MGATHVEASGEGSIYAVGGSGGNPWEAPPSPVTAVWRFEPGVRLFVHRRD